MNRYVYPKDAQGVVDVTKAPYFCDNTGKTDCTAALCRAIDDIFSEYKRAFDETNKKLDSMEGDEAWIGFEIRRVNGQKCVIWPETLPESKIIYFPSGTYLVSDTVSYSLEHFRNIFNNVPYLEMNCRLRLLGECMQDTVIKLKDNYKGFEYGSDRPVISFMRGEASNIAMTNMIENLTVDTGKGNHGAIGVVHFANNTGAARNLRIISRDGGGSAGFAILHDKASACLGENIEVDGFDYGFKVTPQTHFAFFEHIKAKNQKRAGFFVGDTVVSINDYESDNACPALRCVGTGGHTVCINGKFHGRTKNDIAVRHEFGTLYLRNIEVDGYWHSLTSYYSPYRDGNIEEFSSHGSVTGLDKGEAHTLNLPVEDTPDIPWEAPEKWVSVNSFGAVGDGVTPASDSIQAALFSGATTVYFQPGKYLLDKPVTVPASVNRINFMYCDLCNTDEMKHLAHTGLFKITGESDTPLVMEDLFAFEQLSGRNTLIDHATKRTLVLSDLHTQAVSMYFNSVSGGKVFMENVGCTLGGIPGTGGAGEKTEKAREEQFSYSRDIPCYHFIGQKVWARQINPERSTQNIINDNSSLWVLGFKSEEEGTAFTTVNGGQTEVLGGTLCICYADRFPAIINRDSRVSVISSSITYARNTMWSRVVEESKNGVVHTVKREECPVRFMDIFLIPLYHGDLRK